MCGPSTPNIQSLTSILKHPHFITTQHPTTITQHNISSPTNTQQLSPSITFHHHLTPITYHPPSHFITNQHPSTITQHNISSPTNTQQLSPNITFHHQPTPNNYHPA
ncbi:hypothetical protein [Prevotella melaninogenica]|uniref:hypothetical protein n=1 Tax=Prevotella melaninogenica TaxID=28132 RepID=UPI0012DEBF4A|nr:hypothetical protein [Prevotella melaninogenica]UEB07860.1 hypothetical protein LK441_07135 [Prevotella melaninogenica]